MTPVRAAWILGARREQKAVPALTKIVKKAKDAFLVESAVEALGKNRRQCGELSNSVTATQHSSLRVRVKAREVLRDLGLMSAHGDEGKGLGINLRAADAGEQNVRE